jgi:hypothetical protein
MTTTYHPRKAYFTPNRIQLTGKEIIKECAEDRSRALEAFEYFKNMVDSNPEDDRAKSEMIKALDLSMTANNKKVKMLDLMVKLAMYEDKAGNRTLANVPAESLSFEEIKALKGN